MSREQREMRKVIVRNRSLKLPTQLSNLAFCSFLFSFLPFLFLNIISYFIFLTVMSVSHLVMYVAYLNCICGIPLTPLTGRKSGCFFKDT